MAKLPPSINQRIKGNTGFNAELRNLNAVRRRFTSISKAIEGESPDLFKSAWGVITEAFTAVSDELRDKTKLRRAIKSAPRRLDKAIFSFSDLSKVRSKAKRRSVLVGVKTGAPPRLDTNLYKRWGRRLNAHNVVTKRAVGMSIARMFESGTSKIQPMNFFASAITQSRSGILKRLAEAYSRAVEMMSDK